MIDRLALGLLRRIDPEQAHHVAINALRLGLVPKPGPVTSPRLATSIAGLDLPNPLGIAAGFDKNAEAVDPLLVSGLGFVEVGAATPRPQPGNPRPRLFRLTEDKAVINRFGFNNDGMEAIATRLAARRRPGVVGLNLGANKDSTDRADDFARVLAHAGPFIDFATVNVSSPNTEKLRDLQGAEALSSLLAGVMQARKGLERPIPVLLKIAPDMDETALAELCDVALQSKVDAIIATNTTLRREGLSSPHAGEAGGLSGAPLRDLAQQVLADVYRLTNGAIPLVGVGGISSGADAYARIRAGASALQIYSALVYGGMALVGTILRDLEGLLARDGFANVADAVGVDAT
ncbi:dihydroorotate oxidase A [Monaibacterium marinum]|uniref:Dihydroorotate dehydrogenase (quinone) n=1 Tax=Pontivivens marinum TaxID=1690039 RepID=A0A2C9CS34_9RHOB|nr:quinone-dependent dihydroorotate dehydrogenase [Monaibacterium marinum]SOH94154.1 dihydroorotate oxidase A [Monaibacterium marinum]